MLARACLAGCLVIAASAFSVSGAAAADRLALVTGPDYAWDTEYGLLTFPDAEAWGRGAAIADVTGDGRDDAVLGISYYNEAALSVMPQLPDGSLGPEVRYPGDVVDFQTSAADVAVGDLDGDGDNDVALSTAAGVNVFFQRPDGKLGGRITVGPPFAEQVEAVDWEGDGDIDLIARDIGDNGDEIQVVRRGAGGAWSSTLLLNKNMNAFAAGDLTNDGRADLVGIGNDGVTTYKQLVGGGLSASITNRPQAVGNSATIGDLNDDGDADVATGGGGVLYGDGTGAVSLPVELDVGGTPAITDLNGDGLSDLVFGSDNLIPAIQRPDHSIDASCSERLVGFGSIGIGVGDLNDDGRTDLLLPEYAYNTYAIIRGAAKGPIDFAYISPMPASIDAGRAFLVDGKIQTIGACPDTSAVGQTIELRRSLNDGPEEVIATTTTDLDGEVYAPGDFSFTQALPMPGSYTYRLRALGDAAHHPTFSAPWVIEATQATDVVQPEFPDTGVTYGAGAFYTLHLGAAQGTANLDVHIYVRPEGLAEYYYADTVVDASTGDATGTITGLRRDADIRFVWDGDDTWTPSESTAHVDVYVAMTGKMYNFSSRQGGVYIYRAGRDPVFSATVTPHSAGKTMRVLVQRLRYGNWRDYLSGRFDIRHGTIVAGVPHQYLAAGDRYRISAFHGGEGNYLQGNQTEWFRFQVKR